MSIMNLIRNYAEAITSQLNQITFVSHHELDSKDQQLQIFGTACLAINLMQEQFVDSGMLLELIRSSIFCMSQWDKLFSSWLSLQLARDING